MYLRNTNVSVNGIERTNICIFPVARWMFHYTLLSSIRRMCQPYIIQSVHPTLYLVQMELHNKEGCASSYSFGGHVQIRSTDDDDDISFSLYYYLLFQLETTFQTTEVVERASGGGSTTIFKCGFI